MPFQFYCPNGHLLQANENQIGQSCVCPHCQIEIIIPAPTGYTPAPSSAPPTPPGAPTSQPPVSSFTGLNSQNNNGNPPPTSDFNVHRKKRNFDFGASQAAAQEAENAAQKPAQKMDIGDPDEDERLHCLCPTGHPLDIDRNMIGQKAMCPYCQKTFVITLERTVEYINKKKRAEELEDKKTAKLLFQWAIVAIVLAVIFIVVMIALTLSH